MTNQEVFNNINSVLMQAKDTSTPDTQEGFPPRVVQSKTAISYGCAKCWEPLLTIIDSNGPKWFRRCDVPNYCPKCGGKVRWIE